MTSQEILNIIRTANGASYKEIAARIVGIEKVDSDELLEAGKRQQPRLEWLVTESCFLL